MLASTFDKDIKHRYINSECPCGKNISLSPTLES